MLFGKKPVSEEEIRKVLNALRHPRRHEEFGALGLIEGVVIKEGDVTFILKLEEGDQDLVPQLREMAEKAVRTLPGVAKARAVFTASSKPAEAAPRKAPSLFKTAHLGKIIAVLSGKGGVGKSTIAANLAVALAQKGLRVGLLDADIYGPSVPRLFDLHDKPRTENNKMVPLEKYNLRIMSIGFIIDEEMPVIWRGPVVQKAIRQMVEDVAWGELDALIIDMPPGTGDVQLTFAQSTPMAGAVIVSTSQELALIDARKAIAMCRQLHVPILGMIENMSGEIFGAGGAKAEAQRIGEEFLGAIPLDARLRETSDQGTPITATDPQNPLAQAFQGYAERIWSKLATSGHKASLSSGE